MTKRVFRDDRGRSIELRETPPDARKPMIRMDLARTPEWRYKIMWTKFHLAVVYLAVWFVAGILSFVVFGPPGWFAAVLIGFAGWAVFFLVFIAPSVQNAVRRLDALKERRCPACWTEIPDDAERDDIGLRQCAECGAWWRLPSRGKSGSA